MPPRLSARRRLATAARWPVGVVYTGWRYLWRTTPLHRTEEAGTIALDGPPPLPTGVSHDGILVPQDGTGHLFHRVYRTRIRDCAHTPESLLDEVSRDLDWVVPTEMASFQKANGHSEIMQVGDEFVVRMPGPWDGPVRVVDKTPVSFRLATLATHLEAGQIEFRTRREGDLLVFEIESWARSSSRLADFLYHTVRMAKETQLHMWTSLLEGVVRFAGGRMTQGIDIHTRRVEK